ncbi:hypothetical protein AUC43_19780 [Hymenobacter sedentarius]|uniref:Glycosyltransferase 2-like domain-containing protein n=2 Tax=Hymenobacter sedentarius TaxID=1411621 RepID=A0A0U4CUK4_9BACT|nr:hypothetical protein AUC43_19780 [Hymenobacter sedentarius]
MVQYKISYILTTYNKLPYLQHVLERLVAARLPDEEIVVCDGGSKDDTPAYLQRLLELGKIQQYVSEPDKGEAHGFNKGMLLARGEIVKIITDDDAFHFPAIRQAAEFMCQNHDIDAILGRSAAIMLNDLHFATIPTKPAEEFRNWLENETPFWMVGLTLILRRRSLALTGLLSTEVVLVDLEFIYRITSLKANIAWCTGILSMHVSNPDGNFNRMNAEARQAEYDRLYRFYSKPVAPIAPSFKEKLVEVIKHPIRPYKDLLIKKLKLNKAVEPSALPAPEQIATNYISRENEDNLEAAYRVCDEFLTVHNDGKKIEFFYKKTEAGFNKIFAAAQQ